LTDIYIYILLMFNLWDHKIIFPVSTEATPPPRLPDLQNFQITQFQISINLKKKGEGKSVPLLARGAQRIPGS